MKVLIGTNNEAKVKKYSTILKELKIDYCTPRDLGVNLDVEETGKTSEENAMIKAKAYHQKVGIPVLVDDCGMTLDKLPEDKQPGVYVRRHNGKVLTDEEMIELYSKEIEAIGGETKGSFNISIAIIDENGKEFVNTIKHERFFVAKPCKERTKGYPMNSLIYDVYTKEYLAQNYEGKQIYKGNSFEQELEFIESVLKK